MSASILTGEPKLAARIAGAFYLVTVLTSLFGFFVARGTHAGDLSNLVAGAAYVVVTMLLYQLLKPVNPGLSLLAAFFGLVGIMLGPIVIGLLKAILDTITTSGAWRLMDADGDGLTDDASVSMP